MGSPEKEAARAGAGQLPQDSARLFSLLFGARPARRRRRPWLGRFKPSVLVYLDSIVSRGSKYIYRKKMSLKHFETHLKKFRFSEAQIRKIKALKKKFGRVFEENLREISAVNPGIPAGFKNQVGFSLEDEAKGASSNSIHGPGPRSVIHREFWERDMAAVGLTS